MFSIILILFLYWLLNFVLNCSFVKIVKGRYLIERVRMFVKLSCYYCDGFFEIIYGVIYFIGRFDGYVCMCI